MTELYKSYCVPKNSKQWGCIYMDFKKGVRNWVRTRFRGDLVYYQDTPIEAIMDAKSDEFVFGERVEVSVEKFLDLLHDRIAPWRLEEVGFNSFEHADKVRAYELMPTEDCALTVLYYDYGTEIQVFPTDIDGETGSGSIAMFGISTFTELLTLIRFLTPPVK